MKGKLRLSTTTTRGRTHITQGTGNQLIVCVCVGFVKRCLCLYSQTREIIEVERRRRRTGESITQKYFPPGSSFQLVGYSTKRKGEPYIHFLLNSLGRFSLPWVVYYFEKQKKKKKKKRLTINIMLLLSVQLSCVIGTVRGGTRGGMQEQQLEIFRDQERKKTSKQFFSLVQQSSTVSDLQGRMETVRKAL